MAVERAVDLRAARVEGVQHEHRGRLAHGIEPPVVRSPSETKLVVERLAERAGGRQAEHLFIPPLVVAALRQIEITNAEIAGDGMVALELRVEHLRLAQRVLDASREVQRVVRLADRVGQEPGRQRGDDRLGIERVDAFGGERERGVLAPQRPVQRHAIPIVTLVALDRREHVARVQRVVAKAGARRPAPRVEPWLGDDVDGHETRLVRVRGEHVPMEPNLRDLILGRQLTAAEAVHADRGAGPRHLFEHPLHLVRIVRQLVDLRLPEHGGERVAAWIACALARVASHVHRFGEPGDFQLDVAPVVARPHAHLAGVVRLESGRLHVNRVPARIERREHRLAPAAGLKRRRAHGHAGADDHGAAGIDDGDPQRRGGLCERGGGQPSGQHDRDQHRDEQRLRPCQHASATARSVRPFDRAQGRPEPAEGRGISERQP